MRPARRSGCDRGRAVCGLVERPADGHDVAVIGDATIAVERVRQLRLAGIHARVIAGRVDEMKLAIESLYSK